MIRPAIARALAVPALLLAVPLAAQDAAPASAPPQLSLEQRMLLRCSAAFALVANRQLSGEEWALAYPPLAEQGREFFVRATARLADETGVEPPALAPVLRAEAESLLDRPLLQQVMPVCLTLLPPVPQG
ncbi:MAG: hypothetical protein V4647_05280 [Pseudomonadota bacterium]